MKCFSYIRFSSPEQAKGKSKERQLDFARQYATEQHWELDESLSMYDPAMSGFHREHISKGELGVFLAAVEAGEIATPCALLVENLDRLSREKILDALTQFLMIIKAGITIVTLMDRMKYDTESLDDNPQQLLISISIMARAHEESLVKQIRRSDTWKRSRKEAQEGKKIRHRCASWLKLSDDKKEFLQIPDRVKVVQRIFDLYIKGHGLAGICRKLNRDKIPTFHKTQRNNPWSTTTIRRILSSRTVIGEMQFMTTSEIKDGKRIMVTEGEPISGYYPAIITEKTFYKALDREQLRKKAYGRIGKMQNLFSGLVKCGYCDATMQYGARGRGNVHYLTCKNAILGKCEILGFRYDDFEKAFLLHCTKLKLSNIIIDDISDHGKLIASVNEDLQLLARKITESEKKVDNYTTAIEDDSGDSDTIIYFRGLIDTAMAEQRTYARNKIGLDKELVRLTAIHLNTEKSLYALNDAIKVVNNATGDERDSIRRKLQMAIRQLVSRINVYPHGAAYFHVKKTVNKSGNEALQKEFKKRYGKISGKKHRSCDILFKGGGFLRFRYDSKTNGMKFDTETDGQGLTKRALTRLIVDISKVDNEEGLWALFEDDLIRLYANNARAELKKIVGAND